MKKFYFPTDIRFFQVLRADLPENEQNALKKDEFYIEVFEAATDKEFIENIRAYYDNADKTPLVEYQYAYFHWCHQLSKTANYIIRFVCPVNDNANEICYQFYVVIDKSNNIQYILVSFTNLWEECVALFEEEFVCNFLHRRCPQSLRMYNFGKAALSHHKSIIKDAFLLSPGMSMLVIPAALNDPHPSFWSKCNSDTLEELYNKKIQTPLRDIYEEIPGLISHLKKWDFIYKDKKSKTFCSSKMLPVIISQKDLSKDKSTSLLRKGFADTFYSYDSELPNQSDSSEAHEIQETIQIMENFDFHDSEIIGIVSYDISWPDGTHSWSCKIPLSYTELLTKFDIYELESKLPLFSKAYFNGMMNRFKEGGLIENNDKEMIYLYDYDQYNKGKANKIHLERSSWLNKVILEITKFNQYVEFKNAKDDKKKSEKFSDTLSRGLLYQLLGSIIGG